MKGLATVFYFELQIEGKHRFRWLLPAVIVTEILEEVNLLLTCIAALSKLGKSKTSMEKNMVMTARIINQIHVFIEILSQTRFRGEDLLYIHVGREKTRIRIRVM